MRECIAGVIFALAALLMCPQTGSAQTPSAWGFPLGVTSDELRAAVGTPATVETRTPAPIAAMFARSREPYVSWTYRKNGSNFYVTLVKDRVVSVSTTSMMSTTLGDEQAAPLIDPLGVPLGGTMTQILVKSGAVAGIDARANVNVISALLSVTHDGMRLQYTIANGRIFNESISLISN